MIEKEKTAPLFLNGAVQLPFARLPLEYFFSIFVPFSGISLNWTTTAVFSRLRHNRPWTSVMIAKRCVCFDEPKCVEKLTKAIRGRQIVTAPEWKTHFGPLCDFSPQCRGRKSSHFSGLQISVVVYVPLARIIISTIWLLNFCCCRFLWWHSLAHNHR